MKPFYRSLPGPLQVCLPSLRSVTLGLILNLLLVRLAVDPSADDDHVTSAVQDDFLWRPVLLTHLVSLDIQPNTRSQDHKVLILLSTRRVLLVNPLHGDETKDESFILVSPSHLNGLASVVTSSEVTLTRHLGEDEETSVERLANGGETGDDTVTRNWVRVCDVGPRSDFVNSRRVLKGYSIACELRE